jgi:hypothetical protein
MSYGKRESLLKNKFFPIMTVTYKNWIWGQWGFRYAKKMVETLVQVIGHGPQRVMKDRVTWYAIPDICDEKIFVWTTLEVRDQIVYHRDHYDFLYGTLQLRIFPHSDTEDEFIGVMSTINAVPGNELCQLTKDLYKLQICGQSLEELHKKLKTIKDKLKDTALLKFLA